MIIWNLLDGGPCHSGPILVREGGSNYSSCHEPTFVQMRVPFGIGDPPPRVGLHTILVLSYSIIGNNT
jgi:hypothetical protein